MEVNKAKRVIVSVKVSVKVKVKLKAQLANPGQLEPYASRMR